MKTLLAFVLVLFFVVPGFSQDENKAGSDVPSLSEVQKEQVESQQLMSQIMMAMYSPSMQKELSLTQDQIKELQPLIQDYQQRSLKFMTDHKEEIAEAQELMKSGKMAEAGELMKGFQEDLLEQGKNLVKKAETIMLPHQLDRIRQISKQQMTKMTNRYRDEFGIPYALADEIELSKEEKKLLKETIERVREEYYEKSKLLKEKAHKEILESIPAEKRDRLSEILGETFDSANQFGIEPAPVKAADSKEPEKENDK